jgi:poly-gamma-glutamate synthesis protein (capsule biosynthesis protein)
LIDGDVDIVHGHSSHHPRPIELYRNKLVLYGCGDFIDDYEGITGFEAFRDDLVLLYLPTVNPHNGELLRLRITPFRIRRMRLNRVSPDDAGWLRDTIHRVSCEFGTAVDLAGDGALMLC